MHNDHLGFVLTCPSNLGTGLRAGAMVNKDVKLYGLMVGVPAKQIGWMSKYGEQIPLPVIGQGHYSCPHSGEKYYLGSGELREVK